MSLLVFKGCRHMHESIKWRAKLTAPSAKYALRQETRSSSLVSVSLEDTMLSSVLILNINNLLTSKCSGTRRGPGRTPGALNGICRCQVSADFPLSLALCFCLAASRKTDKLQQNSSWILHLGCASTQTRTHIRTRARSLLPRVWRSRRVATKQAQHFCQAFV